MRHALILFLMLVIATPALAERSALGIYYGWGAFRDTTPQRCFAITQAQRRAQQGERQAFVSVSYWPQQRQRDQIYFRLSRPKRQGSAILLRIDDRTFQMMGGGADAWAPDRTADAFITRAMRTGLAMTIETRGEGGATIRDRYVLRGAATAIDAAAIGCAR